MMSWERLHSIVYEDDVLIVKITEAATTDYVVKTRMKSITTTDVARKAAKDPIAISHALPDLQIRYRYLHSPVSRTLDRQTLIVVRLIPKVNRSEQHRRSRQTTPTDQSRCLASCGASHKATTSSW
jgi:hypothetical protein